MSGVGPTVEPTSRLGVRPQVLSRRLENEIVLLDPEAGTYFGLNEVGARVWELIQTPTRLEEVHRRLLAEYEVDAEQLWGDLRNLVRELLERDLAVVQP